MGAPMGNRNAAGKHGRGSNRKSIKKLRKREASARAYIRRHHTGGGKKRPGFSRKTSDYVF
jgi:hypothetical protein